MKRHPRIDRQIVRRGMTTKSPQSLSLVNRRESTGALRRVERKLYLVMKYVIPGTGPALSFKQLIVKLAGNARGMHGNLPLLMYFVTDLKTNYKLL